MPDDPDFDIHKWHHEKWWYFSWTWKFDWPWNRGSKMIGKRGHGQYFPWWFLPVMIILYPFLWLKDKFTRKEKKK